MEVSFSEMEMQTERIGKTEEAQAHKKKNEKTKKWTEHETDSETMSIKHTENTQCLEQN